MGFLNKLRGELKSENRSEPTGWENMAAPTEIESSNSELEKQNAARQEAKLVQALLPGNGNPNLSAIAGEPREAGPHDKELVLAKIQMGQIGNEDFSAVLNGIKGPLTDRAGNFNGAAADKALESISSDAHQLKILAFANGYNVDEHFQNTSISDLSEAVSHFKNPLEFEEKMAPFMKFLAEHNSEKKVAEYESAMQNLEKSLFGKKFEYSERIKGLQAESERYFGKPITAETSAPAPANVAPTAPRSTERERGYENLVKGGSFYQISRAQARSGMRAEMGNTLPVDTSCEDSSFQDLENGFFGVFDGAGGHEGGRRASSICAETMKNLMIEKGEPKSPSELSDWLDEASLRVANDSAAGLSTATLAKVIRRDDGGKAVMYAQVGDSRLYIVHQNGKAELITKDEGFERYLTNAMGQGKEKTCMQAGYRELNDGDKLVLCSDGITGDKGDDLMSEDELGQTVQRAGDSAYAAQALVHQARKNDDRTAIVVEV